MLRRAFEEFIPGEQVEFSRTFTESEVMQFVGLSWDVNPFHTDDEFCKTHRVGKRIVPGLLVGSMLTHVGGLAAVLAAQLSFEFLAPVYIGDTVTATCTVREVDATRGWAHVELRGVNQQGTLVVRGQVQGYPMRWRDHLLNARA